MNTQRGAKLKKLFGLQRPGAVYLSKWLESQGISRELQKVYRKNKWLESVGAGALKRPGDWVGWQAALHAMQQQAKLQVHAGALTALSQQGAAHYFRMREETVFLFSPPKIALPGWFVKNKWGHPINHIKTKFLPDDLALTLREEENFAFAVSAPERAILECLYLAVRKIDLAECLHLMEGLSNLRPNVLQELLGSCASVKVKRLFLYMADKAQHQWLSFIDQKIIDVGTGDRSITKGGTYISDFRITVPKEIVR